MRSAQCRFTRRTKKGVTIPSHLPGTMSAHIQCVSVDPGVRQICAFVSAQHSDRDPTSLRMEGTGPQKYEASPQPCAHNIADDKSAPSLGIASALLVNPESS